MPFETGTVVPLVLETDDEEFRYSSFPLKPKFPHPLNGFISTDSFLLAAQGALRIYGKYSFLKSVPAKKISGLWNSDDDLKILAYKAYKDEKKKRQVCQLKVSLWEDK